MNHHANHSQYQFSFNPDLAMQQIPHVQDVLYMARITAQPLYFVQQLTRDGVTYFANLGLLFAKAAPELYRIRVNGEDSIELTLARLIIEMCPPTACCLYVDGYVEAAIRAGLLDNIVRRWGSRAKNKACACRRCREPLREL